MKLGNFFRLLICLAIPLVVGAIAGAATRDAVSDWYNFLEKPIYNPPNEVFMPVWTVLYLLMGISLYLIVTAPPSDHRTNAILIFALQLFLNFWWSMFFFIYKRPDIALVEITCLWLAVFWMIIAFRSIKPWAGYLQIPYLAWLTFASALNAAIWTLNK